ncbi:Uncharacterized protein Adt_26846 [Abeliophyllum distichum]|uniref:Uncharacterized protein n=1 Tax=Abeliophyllum distichum TaxID=126358 RepID=A0ABD1RSA0_9LAMI
MILHPDQALIGHRPPLPTLLSPEDHYNFLNGRINSLTSMVEGLHHTDWLVYDVECTIQERSSQIDDRSSKAKLVHRRSNKSSRNEVQPPPPPPSEFQFMPTPQLGLTNTTQYDMSNHSLTKPVSSRIEKSKSVEASVQIQTESIPLKTMVKNRLRFKKMH